MKHAGCGAFCSVLMIGLFTATVVPPAALGAWRAFPSSAQISAFAKRVDSVVVYSASLPDSAEAIIRDYDTDVLKALHRRQRATRSREWGRRLVAALLTQKHLDGHCTCSLVKDSGDTTEVVVPMAELHIANETMWVVVFFADSCARVILQQGNWGTARLDEDFSALLAMFRDALPNEEALARDSFPPRSTRLLPSSEMVLSREPPEAIEKIPPTYPEEARTQGVSGIVRVMALVNTDGSVDRAHIVWSIPQLDAAAIAAIRLWRFKPARLGGEAVTVWVVVPVSFKLN